MPRTARTATEVAYTRELARSRIAAQVATMQELFFPPMFDLIRKRSFRQRPHTDDMLQMLTDLGIEPPEFQPTSFASLTFRSRQARLEGSGE